MKSLLLPSLLVMTALTACMGDDDYELDPSTNTDAGNTGGNGSSSSSGGAPDAGEPLLSSLVFRAQVGDAAFSCAESYALGTSQAQSWIRDARLFVSQIELIDQSGARVPFALAADGAWQTERVALLDFESGADACRNGTAERNDTLRGRVPAGNYRGVAFHVGLPLEENHADPSTAPSPLNGSTMHWSWNGGYIFLRVDAERIVTPGEDGGMDMGDGGMDMGDGGMHHGPQGVFLMHLGSMGCSGEAAAGEPVTCSHPNRGEIVLEGFDPLSTPLVVDLGALFAASDLSAADRGGSPGCMASPTDPECAPLLPRVGVDPENGGPSSSTQVLFRAAQ